jgi:hypothetical protein
MVELNGPSPDPFVHKRLQLVWAHRLDVIRKPSSALFELARIIRPHEVQNSGTVVARFVEQASCVVLHLDQMLATHKRQPLFYHLPADQQLASPVRQVWVQARRPGYVGCVDNEVIEPSQL